MRRNPRLIFAIFIACAGLLIAALSLRSNFAGQGRRNVRGDVPVAPLALERLSGARWDAIPTEGTSASLLDEACTIAGERASDARVSERRVGDLVAAFRERLHAVIVADYDRNREDLEGRGDTSFADSSDESRQSWDKKHRSTRLAPFVMREIEVRRLIVGGVEEFLKGTEEGFGTLLWTPKAGRLRVPDDLAQAKADVVEVRLPMQKRSLANPRGGEPATLGERVTVLVGFRFLWSPRRDMWIPVGVMLYMNPNQVHSSISF